MILRKESLPQANIYSSKVLFDQMEDRNIKRKNQILKRKKALSMRNKAIKFEEEKLYSLYSPKKNDKDEININAFNQFNKSIYNLNDKVENIKKFEIQNSTNDINYNNSTNINSNILNKDSQEREINNSNMDQEATTKIIISNKDQKINDKIINSNINQENKSIINVDIFNFDETINDESKDNNIFNSNEFAIKYLSSSLNSFIRLDNHLVSKVRFQNNCFTDSYSQALELNYHDNFPNIHSKSYLVTEIIKEEKEKEGETPLKTNKKNDKNSHKNKFNINIDENIINKRMSKRRAYSKRIRNNALNKNLNNKFEINKKIEKSLNISKSCKKLKKADNLKLAYRTCGCMYKNSINTNFERKKISNLEKNKNMNNSFIILNQNDKNKICNLKKTKTLTTINSSKNIVKNEKIFQRLYSSKSNLNIFKKNITQIKNNNINNLNISIKNCYQKLIEKNKMRKSKSVKRIINHNLNDKKYKNNNNPKVQQNNNGILRKYPTLGSLRFIKKTNVNKKDNSTMQKKNDNDANSNILRKQNNKNDNYYLYNTKSYKNIKKIANINNNINTRNSMPLKQKTNKISKKILNTDKTLKNLKLNKSYSYLNS